MNSPTSALDQTATDQAAPDQAAIDQAAPVQAQPDDQASVDVDEDWRDDLDALVHDEFHRRAALPESDPERDRIRNAVICAGLPLARRTAQRFRSRGEPLDDLVQVATVGLIKSVDR